MIFLAGAVARGLRSIPADHVLHRGPQKGRRKWAFAIGAVVGLFGIGQKQRYCRWMPLLVVSPPRGCELAVLVDHHDVARACLVGLAQFVVRGQIRGNFQRALEHSDFMTE